MTITNCDVTMQLEHKDFCEINAISSSSRDEHLKSVEFGDQHNHSIGLIPVEFLF